MARTRLWSAFIIGLVGLGSFACTKSDPPALTVREPLKLDASGETLSLDEAKVPVVASCDNGQIVKKAGTGWTCVDPGPGGVAVTWETVTGKPENFPPAVHAHSWSEVADKPESFPPAAHTHDFTEMTGVTESTEWPGTQPWSRVMGAPDFALSSTVGAMTSRVSSAEGAITTAQGRLTQVEERVGALESSGGASTLVMSIKPHDSALTEAGYSMVGLGRPESYTARSNTSTTVSHVLGAAVLGTKVYTSGGHLSGSQPCLPNLREYDLVTNKWTSRQQMSVARYAHVVVGARGKVYAIGGFSCSGSPVTKVTEIYDPQLNTWTQGASLPDHNHAAAAYGILSDGKLHVVGGYDHTTGTVSRSHVVYDFDTNTWSTARELPVPRYWSSSGVLADGRLIVAGGLLDSSTYKSETYIFDPATGAWTQVASMPAALGYHPGAVIANRFHTFMGHTGTADVASHYIYDPESDTWSSGAAVPYAGYAPSVAQLRGGALLIGGWVNSNGAASSAVYEYLAPLYLYSK